MQPERDTMTWAQLGVEVSTTIRLPMLSIRCFLPTPSPSLCARRPPLQSVTCQASSTQSTTTSPEEGSHPLLPSVPPLSWRFLYAAFMLRFLAPLPEGVASPRDLSAPRLGCAPYSMMAPLGAPPSHREQKRRNQFSLAGDCPIAPSTRSSIVQQSTRHDPSVPRFDYQTMKL
jgi:hypothetical protein